jgi:hypothetical protein
LTVKSIDKEEGRLPPFPPYDAGHDLLSSCAIAPGEPKQFQVPLDPFKGTFLFRYLRNAHERRASVNNNVYCFGFIQYRDDAKVERRTAFCLHYDIGSGRFDRVADEPNYDYAD